MSSSKQATKEYHDDFYRRANLFEKGTWIGESEQELVKLVKERFSEKENVRILDLGSGVGRNAIPIAKIVGKHGGTVTCVDVLDIAIEKLLENAEKYNVASFIETKVQDLEDYIIEPNHFDLIIAYSSIEHGVSNKENFFKIIELIKQGTKDGGVNFLGITTDLQELDDETRKELPKDIGYDATYNEAEKAMEKIYSDWKILEKGKSSYKEKYMKNGRMIIWKTEFLTFVAEKT